jgi:ribosomal protein S18 acetylase RimI-like enzyme
VNDVHIIEATPDDTDELLDVIRRAFTSVAEQYGEPAIPPLTETAEAFRARFSDHIVLKAVDGERIVGGVVGVMRDDTCLVGRLAVEPAMQGRGLGRALAMELETRFPDARRFELFTGHNSVETLGLYKSLGFHEFRREHVTERLTLVYLEKTRD